MRVIKARRTFEAGERYTLYPIGDTHLGAECAEDELRALVARIEKDPNAMVIFMGDTGDLIDHRDRRFHPGMLPQRYQDAMFAEGGIPTETVEHSVEIFTPIKDKILVWLSGNHERTVRTRTDREIGSEIAGRLGVEYGGYGCFVRIQFTYVKSLTEKSKPQGVSCVIDAHHGASAGTTGNKINKMISYLCRSDADIVLRGHHHDRVAYPFDATTVGTDFPRPWKRVVAGTGTFKKGHADEPVNGELHDTWEHTRDFARRHTYGPPEIEIYPQTRPGGGIGKTRGEMAMTLDYRIIQ